MKKILTILISIFLFNTSLVFAQESGVTACQNKTQECFSSGIEVIKAVFDQKFLYPETTYNLINGNGQLDVIEKQTNTNLSQVELNRRNAIYAAIDVFIFGATDMTISNESYNGYLDTAPEVVADIASDSLISASLSQDLKEQIGGFINSYFLSDRYTENEVSLVSKIITQKLSLGDPIANSNIIVNSVNSGINYTNANLEISSGTVSTQGYNNYTIQNNNQESTSQDAENWLNSVLDNYKEQDNAAMFGAIMGTTNAMRNTFGVAVDISDFYEKGDVYLDGETYGKELDNNENTLFSGLYDKPSMKTVNDLKGLPKITSGTQLIIWIINWLLSFVGMIGILFVILGGFQYITAGGDDTKMEQAKKIIISAIIGIMVILLSFTITFSVSNIISNTADDYTGNVFEEHFGFGGAGFFN